MIYSAFLGPFKFMPNCSVGPSKCETKFSIKHFGMGYVKMHGFHGNPFMILENGDTPTNSSISRVLLILEHKIGVKLKLRHMSFFLWSDM